jgi:hypothetical protein
MPFSYPTLITDIMPETKKPPAMAVFLWGFEH